MIWLVLALIATSSLTAFAAGQMRARAFRAHGRSALHSLPVYHGAYVGIIAALPMIAVIIVWSAAAPVAIEHAALANLASDLRPADALARDAMLRDIELIAGGAITDPARLAQFPDSVVAAAGHYARLWQISHIALLVALAATGLIAGALAWHRVSGAFRARNSVERIVVVLLIACSAVAVLTTIGIVLSVLFETLRFFAKVSVLEFLFGAQWSPQTALRADQVGSSGAFGAVPLFIGTAMITFIAMCVAGPVGLLSAIYLTEYAGPRFRAVVKPMLEVLAGIPTVVFGFFAALTVAPLIRRMGESVGFDVASESALAAGIVMGVMIIPFMSSLSDDIINAVPQSLRDGSYALGATRSETVKRVLLPAALPGIVSAFMLSISRAVGETMIVVMAAGLAAHRVSWDPIETFNPLQAVTTVTVQIATLLVGDQEFDSAKTLSAFALGFVLFFFTLAMNIIALSIVSRYREQYD